MAIPWVSILTLLAEILITVLVYFVIWYAYRTGKFIRRLAFGILLYELIFNISYMISREVGQKDSRTYNPYETALGIFHGVFSIVMFLTLVVFFLFAAHAYQKSNDTKKENFFRVHTCTTVAFVCAWAISILSGILLFSSLYLF
jgi:cation transport ATPase